jgi:subtilase family serine protease
MMTLPRMLKLSLLPAVAMLFSQAVFGQFSASAVVPKGKWIPGTMRPHLWRADVMPLVHGPGQPASTCTASGCYYYPADITTAYATAFINGNGGAGITVGIVDAFYNSQTEADLQTFDLGGGFFPALPVCTIANGCLTIVSQTGGSPTGVGSNAGWAQETNLDVQWVHAIAPNAKILLVAANNNSNANLSVAVSYAVAHADIVTNSYGGAEGALSFDPVLSASTVPILFSSGDAGAEVEYPCSSRYATCVGGTNLLETASSFRAAESVWGDGTTGDGGTGGGCSTVVAQPTYQAGFSTSVCTASHRGVPDIAGIADPATGVLVYLGAFAGSTASGAGFYEFGGTSLASPATAAMFANIDNARIAAGKTRLGSNLNALLYAGATVGAYNYRFWDVTAGSSGFAATTGWDRATGLGVPLGPALSFYLIGTP